MQGIRKTVSTTEHPPDQPTYSPVQILEFVKNPTGPYSHIKLNEKRLQEILQLAGDRPVCIYAIAGKSRRGKSFFLNFMLRYLEQQDSIGSQCDWMQWEKVDHALTGFSFRSSIDRDTTGIVMWGKPFILKDDDGNEVAVLLMDTQGTNDDETTDREAAAIFGISLLISSSLIFNFFTQLQEDVFQSLETYVQYALLATADNNDETPFQNIMFLIRDWNTPTVHNYGLEGGRDYIHKVLNETKAKMTTNAKNVRKLMQQSFAHLDCCLLPAPGEKSRQKGFKGSLAELEQSFSRKVEEVVEELLSPENFSVKRISGTVISAPQLAEYLKNYVELFNSDDLPSPEKIIDATAKTYNQTLIDGLFREFMDEYKQRRPESSTLTDATLEVIQSDLAPKYLALFQGVKKFGSMIVVEEYSRKLKNKMDEYHQDVSDRNKSLRQSLVDSTITSCRMRYMHDIKQRYIGKPEHYFLEDEILEDVYRCHADPTVISDAMEGDCEEAIITSAEQKYLTCMENQKQKSYKDNDLRKKKAETLGDALRQKFETEFLDELEAIVASVGGLLGITNEQLKSKVEGVKADFLQRLEAQLVSASANTRSYIMLAVAAVYQRESITLLQKNMDETFKLEQELEQLSATTIEAILLAYESYKSNHNGEEMDMVSTIDLVLTKVSQHKSMLPQEKSNTPFVEDFFNNLRKQAISILTDRANDSQTEDNQLLNTTLEDAMERFEEALQDISTYDDDFDRKLLNEKQSVIQYFESRSTGKREQSVRQHKSTLEEKLETRGAERKRILSNMREQDEASWNSGVVQSCEENYRAEMAAAAEDSMSESEFAISHADAKSIVLATLSADVRGGETLQYSDRLSSTLDNLFGNNLLPNFKVSLTEKANILKEVGDNGIKIYKQEVDTVINNHDFLHPTEMKRLHTTARTTVIDTLRNTFNLCDAHIEYLDEKLDAMFLNYCEENKMNVPQESSAIGIDLGTTCCCVGVYMPKVGVKIIPNQGGSYITPSYVCIGTTGIVETTGLVAKDNSYVNAERTVYDAKRLIGRRYNDPMVQQDKVLWPFAVVDDDGAPVIQLVGNPKKWIPEEISAELLKAMKLSAETFLGSTVSKAVITVPAYFNDAQRTATRDAGEVAGLNVLQILTEPVAAAVAYKMQCKVGAPQKVLIFDLGGGTLDVAVLQIDGRNVNTLAIDGDTHLGGEDFDNNLMLHCVNDFKQQTGIDLLLERDALGDREASEARTNLRRLHLHCEGAKKVLSSAQTAKVSVDGFVIRNNQTLHLKVDVRRAKFEDLNNALFEKAMTVVQRCLQKASIQKHQLDEIVLVGGSTRIPKIRSMLQSFFNGKALNTQIDVDQAVAYGAAMQAALFNGAIAINSPNFIKIVDATPLSLGVQVYGGEFAIMIPKNTPLPARFKEEYRTAHNNQTSVQIIIFQGEDIDVAVNNERLGEFILNGIPSDDAGKQRIDVTMEMSMQGILKVTAKSQANGVEENLTVKDIDRDRQRQRIQRVLDEARPNANNPSTASADNDSDSDSDTDEE